MLCCGIVYVRAQARVSLFLAFFSFFLFLIEVVSLPYVASRKGSSIVVVKKNRILIIFFFDGGSGKRLVCTKIDRVRKIIDRARFNEFVLVPNQIPLCAHHQDIVSRAQIPVPNTPGDHNDIPPDPSEAPCIGWLVDS